MIDQLLVAVQGHFGERAGGRTGRSSCMSCAGVSWCLMGPVGACSQCASYCMWLSLPPSVTKDWEASSQGHLLMAVRKGWSANKVCLESGTPGFEGNCSYVGMLIECVCVCMCRQIYLFFL